MGRVPLQREMVVRAALALLDEVGLDGLTMRRLATELHVQNPALYWHFKNKQDLLGLMAETMIQDAFAELPPPAPDDAWDAWLPEVARAFRRALLSHRDGSRVLAEADLGRGTLLDGLDGGVRVLTAAGFRPEVALLGIITLFDYTLGTTFEEQADPERPLDPTIVDEGFRAALDPVRHATLYRLVTAFAAESPGAIRANSFEWGIRLIIAGLRTQRAADAE